MLALTAVENKVSDAIISPLSGIGYDLVRVKMLEGGRGSVLQIMLDRVDGEAISVDDCEKASRLISDILDVEDPVPDNYNLEVSSPGVDRPLTRIKDFERYKGLEIKLQVLDKIDERRKFRGILQGLDGDFVVIKNNVTQIGETEKDELFKIEYNNIRDAKLVLNDKLLAAHSQ